MLHSQNFGSIGYQPTKLEGATKGKVCKVAILRALYTEGKLTLAQAVKIAKPIDHARALASGKVEAGELIAMGIDLHKAQIAFNRVTGSGKIAEARKRSAAPSIIDAQLLASNPSDKALAKVLSERKAKRQADKQAKAGKVYSKDEIAALQAKLIG